MWIGAAFVAVTAAAVGLDRRLNAVPFFGAISDEIETAARTGAYADT
jgi:hypothetical protein